MIGPSVFELPPAEPNYPTCPSCMNETDFEDGEFVCFDCGIAWDIETYHSTPAHFYQFDVDQQACGAIETENAAAAGPLLSNWLFEQSPCLLPKGHRTVGHYTPSRYTPTHTSAK